MRFWEEERGRGRFLRPRAGPADDLSDSAEGVGVSDWAIESSSRPSTSILRFDKKESAILKEFS